MSSINASEGMAGSVAVSAASNAPRTLWSDLLELWALAAFAVAQPIYSRLANRPLYLEWQSPTALVLLMVGLSVALPLGLAGISVLCRAVPGGWYRAWHGLTTAMLLLALGLIAAHPLSPHSPFDTVILLALGGTAVGLALLRWCPPVRAMLRLAALGSVIFPAVFAWQAFVPRLWTPPIATVRAERPVPVVMVVFDEFCGVTLMDENRRLNGHRFPGLATLAQAATWYRNATSVHPRTAYAVPAILTGCFPPDRSVEPMLSEYPQNLLAMIEQSGQYEAVVSEPFTHLFPGDLAEGIHGASRRSGSLAAFFETVGKLYAAEVVPLDFPFVMVDLPLIWFNMYDPALEWQKRTGLIKHRWDTERAEQLDHFLECIQTTEQPGFYFAHACLPHFPWCYLPSGRQYRADEGFAGSDIIGVTDELQEAWGPDELAANQAAAQYLLQAQFADRQIGRLIERLKEVGIYDECLMIVTADHGISFRPNRSRRIAAADSYADILSVPLLVKLPHQQAGAISDRNVETIDLLPTIAEVLGLSLPAAVDGVSFLDPATPEKPIKRFFNSTELMTVEATFEEKYAVLAHHLAQLGGSRSPERPFRLGPQSELIGQSADAVERATGRSIRAVIDRPRNFLLSEAGGLVPCHLMGHVEGRAADAPPVELAVAVNGIICGTTRTYTATGLRDRWSLLLPEAAFRVGENEVAVLVLGE